MKMRRKEGAKDATFEGGTCGRHRPPSPPRPAAETDTGAAASTDPSRHPWNREGGAATTSTRRHDGQLEWEPSHASTHPAWNPCPHCGSTRSCSPSSNSARQIGHSAGSSPPPAPPYETLGSCRRAVLLRPLSGGARGPPPPRERQGQAQQRATRARPTALIAAQSSAARITTTLVCGSGGGADVVRNLAAGGIGSSKNGDGRAGVVLGRWAQ
ncbi:unnamed protein product [Musa acuminata subsp. burmannicoides]